MRKHLFLLIPILLSSLTFASPSSVRLAGPHEVEKRLELVTHSDFNRVVAKTPLAAVITEPILRALWAAQIITHSDWIGLQGLLSIHRRIDPGGAIDDATNMFAYTCKGGWLDIGHVIFSAIAFKFYRQALEGNALLLTAGASILTNEEKKQIVWISKQLLVKKYATAKGITGDINMWAGYFSMRAGYAIEEQQDKVKRGSVPGKFDANATSSYTLEDLPSDYFGIVLGERMERKHTVRGVTKVFKREILQMLSDLKAVNLQNTNDVRGCDAKAEDVLKKDANYYAEMSGRTYAVNKKGVSADPKSVYNFTIHPKKTLRHHCLCDRNDNPIDTRK